MGENADDILDGIVCECCGEWMDDYLEAASCGADFDPPGHPRRCEGCKPVSRYKIKRMGCVE